MLRERKAQQQVGFPPARRAAVENNIGWAILQ